MQLTVCLLTRDDAAHLERVLGSVAGVADEVIVADTGSTDATVTTAERCGARVVQAAWDDDFAAGRNQALAAAQGDWILWLNPDEELDPASRAALQSCLTDRAALGWYVRVWEFPRPADRTFSETRQVRLFRNGHGIQFRGRLHPHFDAPLEDTARRHGLRIDASDVVLRHHAYLSRLTPDKLRWAARLFEKELSERPGQLHYLIEYGRTLLLLNDARGHAALAQAATQVLAGAAAPAPPTPTVGLLLEYVLNAPSGVGELMPRPQAVDLAERWFPFTPPVLWARAATDFRADRFQEAIPLLERLIQLGVTGRYDRSTAFDPSIIGGLAWENLGVCWTRLGDWNRAEQCFGKLLTLPGFQEKGRRHFAWVQQRRHQTASAG